MNVKIHNSIILCVPYFFRRLVLQPTRVADKSKTLMDNIFFNSLEFTTFSGNIMHSISDHLIQFVILEDFIIPKPPPKSNVKSMENGLADFITSCYRKLIDSLAKSLT